MSLSCLFLGELCKKKKNLQNDAFLEEKERKIIKSGSFTSPTECRPTECSQV